MVFTLHDPGLVNDTTFQALRSKSLVLSFVVSSHLVDFAKNALCSIERNVSSSVAIVAKTWSLGRSSTCAR